jgi:hypothetical protein
VDRYFAVGACSVSTDASITCVYTPVMSRVSTMKLGVIAMSLNDQLLPTARTRLPAPSRRS